jgi:hypothetical protein
MGPNARLIGRRCAGQNAIYGGLGVLHLEKFATALYIRWPRLEWKDSDKI